MTPEQDYADLYRHEQEILRHESFNYALFDQQESALLGCVYIDPVDDAAAGSCQAEVSWWVVDALADTPTAAELDDFVPRWLAGRWPFTSVAYPFGGAPKARPEPPLERAAERFDLVRTPMGPLDTAAAAALWREFRGAHPAAGLAEPDDVTAFGDSVELADELIGLVLRGVKTATAGLLSDYVAESVPLPREGGHWIVCDGSGRSRAVLQTTEVRLGPADSVDSHFAWDEGEMDRSRRSWLAGHLRYWLRNGAEQTEDGVPVSDVVFERFRVVWPPAAAATAAAFPDSVAAQSVETTLA